MNLTILETFPKMFTPLESGVVVPLNILYKFFCLSSEVVRSTSKDNTCCDLLEPILTTSETVLLYLVKSTTASTSTFTCPIVFNSAWVKVGTIPK